MNRFGIHCLELAILVYSEHRQGSFRSSGTAGGGFNAKRSMAKILYTVNDAVTPDEVAEVFRSSGIRRPSNDPKRIAKMIANANLIVCARDGQNLVGIARALTDFSYCCYISDLAVDRAYSGKGIGKELIRKIQEAAGEEAMILLLSSSNSESYYPRIGFKKAENAWRIPRKR